MSCLIALPIYSFIEIDLRTQTSSYLAKYHYLQKHKDQIDTIFYGSSRTHNGINTSFFKKLTKSNSYNLGIPASSLPRSVQNLENFYRILKDSSIKRIFFEFSHSNITIDSVDSMENFYNSNFLHYIENFFFYSNDDLRILNRIIYCSFRKLFGATRLFLMKEKKVDEELYEFLEQKKGFFPLFVESYKSRYSDKPYLVNSRVRFLENHTSIKSYNSYERKYEKQASELYQNYLIKVLKRYEDLGVEIILFMPPGTHQGNVFRANYKFLEETNYPLIDLSSKEHNPKLFDPNMYFDAIHFNKSGADTYTKMLADEFLKIQSERNF